MREVFDFMISALPWVAMGLFVSTSCAMIQAKKEGKEVGRLLSGLCWAPAGCFLYAAVMELYIGNRSNGTVWMILAVFNVMINYASMQKGKDTE